MRGGRDYAGLNFRGLIDNGGDSFSLRPDNVYAITPLRFKLTIQLPS